MLYVEYFYYICNVIRKETTSATINLSAKAVEKIKKLQEVYKKMGINVTVPFAVNEIIEKSN